MGTSADDEENLDAALASKKRGYGGRWERSGGKSGESFGELHSGNEPSKGAREEETEEKQGSW